MAFCSEVRMFSAMMDQRNLDYGIGDAELGAGKPAENEWILFARNGDMDAFNCLVIRYQDSLYGWVVSIVNDEAQADDITQATFIAAYEKLHTYRSGSFKAWLFTIARNRSLDELRRRKRRPTLYLDDAGEDDRDRLELLPDHAPTPEERLLASEQTERIERLLGSLPEMFQQVLRLVDMEGLDYQDTARVLNLPLGTVKSRLTRARLKLRGLFEETRPL
jgi:RNA polymerase sigma-70 factor, ECF subfamily